MTPGEIKFMVIQIQTNGNYLKLRQNSLEISQKMALMSNLIV